MISDNHDKQGEVLTVVVIAFRHWKWYHSVMLTIQTFLCHVAEINSGEIKHAGQRYTRPF